MHYKSDPVTLILGSKSPRRSQLLREAGFEFEIRVQDGDEAFDPDMPPLDVAVYLAKTKAAALRHTLSENEVLLTADSVVILDGIIYNKPADYDEGIAMLSSLSGRTHTVATGVCVTTLKEEKAFTVITEVTFDIITADEMDYYLRHFHPYDKAGAYGIQEWIGWCKISRLHGSYSNVMGLPVREVYMALRDFGITI